MSPMCSEYRVTSLSGSTLGFRGFHLCDVARQFAASDSAPFRPLAFQIHRTRSVHAIRWATAWNLFGVLDLIVAPPSPCCRTRGDPTVSTLAGAALLIPIAHAQPGLELTGLADPKALERARIKADAVTAPIRLDRGFSDALPYL